MERSIDLDLAAVVLTGRLDRWRADGFFVEGPTWRESSEWPQLISVDRGDMKDPDSIGSRIRRGKSEGSVVLFLGGWVDLEYWYGNEHDDVVVEAPGWGDPLTVDSFADLLDRWRALFG